MEAIKSLVKKFEGERLTAYKDSAGLWTIGVGHLIKPNEQHLITAPITPEQSTALFKQDISSAMDSIKNLVKVSLTPNMTAALASFIFNVGGTAFANSTLLKKLNSGDYQGAADEFLKWNKAGGNVVAGLTNRRTAERNLFLT